MEPMKRGGEEIRGWGVAPGGASGQPVAVAAVRPDGLVARIPGDAARHEMLEQLSYDRAAAAVQRVKIRRAMRMHGNDRARVARKFEVDLERLDSMIVSLEGFERLGL